MDELIPRCPCGALARTSQIVPMTQGAAARTVITCTACDNAVSHVDPATAAEMWAELVECGEVKRRSGAR
jgi:hypothetical protein